MKIGNMIVVPHDDLLPEPVWLIFGVGLSGFAFIDSASSEKEAYEIIDSIEEKIQCGLEQEQEEIEFLFSGKTPKFPQ